jgi:hypothetical protein
MYRPSTANQSRRIRQPGEQAPRQRHPRQKGLIHELSFSKDPDRSRLKQALVKQNDAGLLVLGVTRGNAVKFRRLIREVLAATSDRGIDDVTQMLHGLERRKSQSVRDAEAPSTTAEVDRPQRAWVKLMKEFLSEFKSATPRELAELTGSQAKNVAARAYDWSKAGRVFGVNDGRDMRYPLFQLKDGRPIPEIAKILGALRSRRFSDWEIAVWFSTPNTDIGEWEVPANALAWAPEDVVRAAAAKAEDLVY